jgi:hypothetical protein
MKTILLVLLLSTFVVCADSTNTTVRVLGVLPKDAEAIKAVLAKETTNMLTQVWRGPDGRVGATTIRSNRNEGDIFWFKRVGGRWRIENRGVWKVPPPPIQTHDIDAG